MNKIILFDIDATLTPPRQPIDQEMTNVLKNLAYPFALVAGSHMKLLLDQFFIPFYEQGYRGRFDAFISNGTMRYLCDYGDEMIIDERFSFDFRKYIGDEYYHDIVKSLEEVLLLEDYKLPDSIEILTEKITDRGNMVNFIPMGRANKEGQKEQDSRAKFVEFDCASKYREKIITHLNGKLSEIIKEKKLKILLGGQTSFDIVIDGYDKTYPLTKLREEGCDEIVFIGDALFPGGNDYVVQEYIDKIETEGRECFCTAIRTDSWQNTIEILRDNSLIK